MVFICGSLNFVFQVILYNATTSVWASKKWPTTPCPHTSHGCLHIIVRRLCSQQARPDLPLNQCLLGVFPFTGSPPLKFFLPSALIFLPLPFFIFTKPLCSHHHSQSVFTLLLFLVLVCHLRRKWQPTPIFLPGKSHGQRSLVGCNL